MKNIKNILFIIGIICILFVPNKIFASTILNCDKTTLNELESTTCSINISNVNETLTSFSGTILLSKNLELVSSKDNWGGNSSNGQFNLNSTNGSSNIGTIVVKAKSGVSNSNEAIAITNMKINNISYNDFSVTINIPTFSNPNLKGLTINNGSLSPEFNENTTNYSATVNSSSVIISATAPNKGSVEGVGTKNLNYGTNTFNIISKAENGETKTYKLTIIRKDTEVRLKSLEPVNNFTMGTTLYNVTLPNTQDTYTINAVAMSERSTVTIEPSNTIKLNPGEIKTITVTVTSESGNKKIYTVNVTRKSDNNSNTLKSLTIKDTYLKFKPNTFSYKINVKNDIEEIEISAEAYDKNSKIEGIGKHKLNVGSNTIKIIVIDKNNNKKTYTLTIIREDENGNIEKLSNNTNLKAIKINDQDLTIKENVFTYSLSVENNINIVDLIYELEDEKATAVVEGNNELIVGNNNFKIIVTAEDGTTKTYEILIERKELNNTIENDKDKILDAINNPEFDTIVVTVKNNDNNRIIHKEILEVLKKENKTIIYEVLNEYQGLSYSVTIDSNNITSTSDDLEYSLSFESKSKNIIDMLSNNAKSIYLSFNTNEKLPALTKFKIFIGEKFKNKDPLHLYYFNKEDNKLELIKRNLNVENSYVEFELNHFSEYILVDSLINEITKTNSTNNINKIVIISVLLIIVVILMIFIVIKSKKKKLKEKNNNIIDNNIQETNNDEKKDISLKEEIKKEQVIVENIEKEEIVKDIKTDGNKENIENQETDDIEIIDM